MKPITPEQIKELAQKYASETMPVMYEKLAQDLNKLVTQWMKDHHQEKKSSKP